MRKLILSAAVAAVAAVLALITPATAADMPLKAPPPVAAPYNWTGSYYGVNAGWVHDAFDWRYTNPSPATCCAPFSDSNDNFILGAHTGFQVQFNQIVVGVETAILSGSQDRTSFTGCIAPNSLTVACQMERGTTFTAGGRLGWAWGDWLLFGSGGAAWAHVRTNLANPVLVGGTFDTTDRKHTGWYAGGGFEWVAYKGSIADMIVGLEYQHIDLGDELHLSSLDGFAGCPPGVNCRNISATSDIVRARVSLKWNPFVQFFR